MMLAPALAALSVVLLASPAAAAPRDTAGEQVALSTKSTARPAPDSAKTAADRTASDGLADLHAAQLHDTELGRALALLDDEPKKAADALEDLEDKLPWIGDVLAYYSAVARGRYDGDRGRRDLEKFVAERSGSVLFGDATAALARRIEADGDADDAAELADRHGKGGPDDAYAASVCLSAGRLLSTKDARRAHDYLQCARQKAPLSEAARAAGTIVDRLRQEHPELRPSGATALLAEARLLGKENRAEEQAALLREILENHPDAASGEAELAYGRILGRTASKSAGADFFEKRAAAATGARKAKLLYEAGTLRWNDDRNAEARVLFEQMLAMKTGIGDEQQALYALARISDVDGRRDDAIRYFGRAAALAKGTARAESQWRQGWVSYRAKDFETAQKSFGQMADSAPRGSDTDGRPEALYWQGRSLERLGRKDEARERYLAVLAEFPLGYYAVAAEKRLGRRSAGGTAVRRPAPPASLPEPAALALRRAKTLREAGLVTLAARDLAARLAGFDTATRRAILPALPASGAYDFAFKIALGMNEAGEITREEARVYFYPKAHAEIVEHEARKAGIDPVLVYALMRQESAFSATAVSSAKALGLMQLLEKTAVRVAASSGLPKPSAEDLFEPAVNIRLGVRYLAELSKLFDGNIALMAAAYNAGETAASRWQDLARRFDEDEMIEQISYRETRAYVKAVLRNMRNYRSIYGEV